MKRYDIQSIEYFFLLRNYIRILLRLEKSIENVKKVVKLPVFVFRIS